MTGPNFSNDVDLIDVVVPGQTQVITVAVPGMQGPPGALAVGTVTTGAAGSNAAAVVRTLPNGVQVVDFTIPRGNLGPSNSLTIGTVAAGVSAAATITGTAPSQTLNLTLPKGDKGDTGNTGATGPINTITVGTVNTGAPGSGVSVSSTGSAPNQTLNFSIPQGATGATGQTGATGPANVLTIGTVTTSTAGGAAGATITGTSPAQVLNLTIPRGTQGPQGVTGDVGPAGATGATGAAGSPGAPNVLTIGAVNTGASGTAAAASITGASPSQILNLTIPQGPQGFQGIQGDQGPKGDKGDTGSTGPTGAAGQGIAIAGSVSTYANLPTNLTSVNAGDGYLVNSDGKLYIWSGTSFPPNGQGTSFQGPAGPANVLTVGSTTTGNPGTSASAVITGTAPNQQVAFTIPRGATGDTGPANTLTIGTVSTGPAGSAAGATLTGTAPNQTLNLTVPQGQPGATGSQGLQGSQGDPGPAGPVNVLSVGTVTTGSAGSEATASITGISPNQVLNLTIPQGAAGSGASDATTISKGSVQLAGDLGGTASAPTVPGLANKLNLAGGTLTGNVVIPTLNNIRSAAPVNWTTGPDIDAIAQNPFGDLWHDLAAFGRHGGIPVHETSTNGTTWTGQFSNPALYSRKEYANWITGPSTTAPWFRWTWDNANFAFSSVRWLIIGYNYSAVAASKTITLETSSDGTTWTTRHVSTYSNVGMPMWHAVSEWGGDSKIRLTMKWNSGDAISLNSIRMLSSRWGDQGGTKAYEVPYDWDDSRNITAPRFKSSQTTPASVDELTRKDYVDGQIATRAATSHTHTASNISDSTVTGRSVLTAIDAAAARTAIGAGTSSLVIGTTSTTAKAGDYAPPSDSAAGVASMRTLGTGATQAAAGNDSRLSDARTPTAHTHTASQISDSTVIGRTVLTSVDATAVRTAIGAGTSSLVIGTTTGTAAAGDDSRLSNARTPVAHTHPISDLTATGTRDATTYLRGDGTWAVVSASSVTASQITDATVIGRTVLTSVDAAAVRTAIGAGTGSSNLVIGTTSTTAKAGDYAPPSDGAAGVATMRTLGTAATQAAAGNDSRLSDARTPTAHTQAASTISDSTTVGRAVLTAIDATAARTAIGAGTGSSNLVIGTTAGTAAAGNDSRLSDARTPTAHTHVATTDLTATGTKDATTFLRGDNTWAAPTVAAPSNMQTTDTNQTVTGIKTFGVGKLLMTDGVTTAEPYSDINAPVSLEMTQSGASAVVNPATGRVTLYTTDGNQLSMRNPAGSVVTTSMVGHTHTAANISDSTATGRSVLTAADATAARTAIGAGTSSLAIGTTSTTAKAGDYAPAAATTGATGLIQLAGALGGTATAPTVPGLALKADLQPAGQVWEGYWQTSSSVIMANNVTANFPFNSVISASTMVTKAANNTDFTILTAGVYDLSASIRWLNAAGAGEKYIAITVNNVIVMNQGGMFNAGPCTLSCAVMKRMAVNDVVRVSVYHAAGANVGSEVGAIGPKLFINRIV